MPKKLPPRVFAAPPRGRLVSDHWFAGASVGWEWLADNPSVSVGPHRVELDLDGGEFSLYLGRQF